MMRKSKSTGPCHTLRLPLATTPAQEREIERRFNAAGRIYNMCVSHVQKLLRTLERNSAYRNARSEYGCVKDDPKQKKRKQELSEIMTAKRTDIGLTQNDLEKWIKVFGSNYYGLISSQQVQVIASRVWKAVEDYLFKGGKYVYFKKTRDIKTIGGKSNTNGVKFDTESKSLVWTDLKLECIYRKDPYKEESIANPVKYCTIERLMFENGYHYYVILCLEGTAPKKLAPGGSTMGIDPGVSTEAAVSETTMILKELAPRAKEYNKKIAHLQTAIENKRRNNNPDKYNEDGTVKKKAGRWKCTKAYHRMQDRIKALYRQKTAYIEQCHNELANEMIRDSKRFISEDMDWKSLQKRSKKTERRESETIVIQKDGTAKNIRKYKRKKRFGKSLCDRAPGKLEEILIRKCGQYGLSYETVDTKEYRASQYNHVTDDYEKHGLSERFRYLDDDTEVQRDLYSAFLIRNTDGTFEHPDKDKCMEEFKDFLSRQKKLTADMIAAGITYKHCFGF